MSGLLSTAFGWRFVRLSRNVVWLVMREVLWLVAIGVVVGLPAAFGLTRLLSSQLYDIQPNDHGDHRTFHAANRGGCGPAGPPCYPRRSGLRHSVGVDHRG